MAIRDSLSIAGFDHIETGAYLDVPLTTVGYSAVVVSQHSVLRRGPRIDL
jgi:DNA-binding LacI/PurR family transcriptional regulator